MSIVDVDVDVDVKVYVHWGDEGGMEMLGFFMYGLRVWVSVGVWSVKIYTYSLRIRLKGGG